MGGSLHVSHFIAGFGPGTDGGRRSVNESPSESLIVHRRWLACVVPRQLVLSAPPPLLPPPPSNETTRAARDIHSLTSATVSLCTVYIFVAIHVTHTAGDHPPHLPQQSLLPLLQPPTRHAGAALEAHAGNTGPIAIILVFNGRGPGVVAARPLRRISSWLWRAPPTAHASVSCDAAATRQPLRPLLIYHLHFTLLFFTFYISKNKTKPT